VNELRTATVAPLLPRAVDAGLLFAVVAVPFAFGGRHEIGQFLLILAAVWTSTCWALHLLRSPHPDWVRSRAEPLLLAVLAIGLLQVIPLPQSVIQALSPRTVELLPMWTDGEAAPLAAPIATGPWSYLSLSISETRTGLVLGVAYVLLFLVAVQRIREVRDAERLVHYVAASGAAMTVFALVQFALSNGRYFWVLEHPEASTLYRPVGAFLNKNHFCAFVTLTLGPLACWLVRRMNHSSEHQASFGTRQSTRLPHTAVIALLTMALALAFIAVFVARSRGGIVATGVASVVLVLTLYAKSLIGGRQLLLMAGLGTTVCLLLGIIRHEQFVRIIHRMDTWSDNGRYPIWQANMEAIRDFPITGTGIGSHRYIYPRYFDVPFSSGEYSHAESGYLQILTETGLAGLTVALLCVGTCFYWCCRGVRISRNQTASLALCAVTASLAATTVHSLADFTWYISGCMVVVVVLMACACRLYQLERDVAAPTTRRFRALPRPVVVSFAAGLIPLALWMTSTWLPRVLAEPNWWRYRSIVLSKTQGRPQADSAESAAATGRDRLKQALMELREGARRNPDDPRFQIRLAVQYTHLFHLLQRYSSNSLALNQIRDTAINGGFESQEELHAWLKRAFPDNIPYAISAGRHAIRAVRLNPLEARGYLYLSELGFLCGAQPGFEQLCLKQALELRPHDAQVLFAAGRDAWLSGDNEAWLDAWKRAFHRDEVIQRQIILQIAQQTTSPAAFLVEAFEPDISAMERAIGILEAEQLPEDRGVILKHLGEKLVERAEAEDNRDRVDDWLKASWAFGQLDAPDQVTECLQMALKSAPSNFTVRLEYGAWMLALNRRADALEHLNWCRRMKPDHPKLTRLIDRAMSSPGPSFRPEPLPRVRQAAATIDDNAF